MGDQRAPDLLPRIAELERFGDIAFERKQLLYSGVTNEEGVADKPIVLSCFALVT